MDTIVQFGNFKHPAFDKTALRASIPKVTADRMKVFHDLLKQNAPSPLQNELVELMLKYPDEFTDRLSGLYGEYHLPMLIGAGETREGRVAELFEKMRLRRATYSGGGCAKSVVDSSSP